MRVSAQARPALEPGGQAAAPSEPRRPRASRNGSNALAAGAGAGIRVSTCRCRAGLSAGSWRRRPRSSRGDRGRPSPDDCRRRATSFSPTCIDGVGPRAAPHQRRASRRAAKPADALPPFPSGTPEPKKGFGIRGINVGAGDRKKPVDPPAQARRTGRSACGPSRGAAAERRGAARPARHHRAASGHADDGPAGGRPPESPRSGGDR